MYMKNFDLKFKVYNILSSFRLFKLVASIAYSIISLA